MKNRILLTFALGCLLVPQLGFAVELPGIVQTVQGSEINLKNNMADAAKKTESAFRSMGIQVTQNKLEESGNKQVIQGRKGESTVEVQLAQTAPDQTHVSVIAKKGLVSLNKDLAQQVIEQIIRAS